MPEPRRERRPLRIALGIGLGVLALPLAAWGTAHSLGLAASEDTGVWLPPTPKGALARIEHDFAENQRIASGDTEQLRKIARSAPLAHEPFALLGFAALQDNDVARAEALLAEARDRRPRSRIARLSLLQIYGRRGEVEPMVGELIPLIRLEPELSEPLTAEWLKVVRSPSDIALLAEILKDHPASYGHVAAQAARADLSPQLLTAFLANDPRSGAGTGLRSDRLLLTALVEQGEYATAFAQWQRRSGVERGSAGQLYNGDLTDRTAPAPFNWDASGNRQGVGELSANGGAAVDYFGRGSATFLRQLVLLAPGSYELAVTQSNEEPDGGGLAWTVRCAGSETTLVERPVPSGANAGLSARFTVPAGCDAQWIALEGRGELRQGEGQRVSIAKVTLRPAGGAR